MTPPPPSVAPFAPRPPPPASPASPEGFGGPPALPPKIPPPPPPPLRSAGVPLSSSTTPSSSSLPQTPTNDTFVIPISSSPATSSGRPSPTARILRTRASLDTFNSPSRLSQTPPRAPHSRSTSVDFGYSEFSFLDAGRWNGAGAAGRGAGLGKKDLPHLVAGEGDEGEEEAELLGFTPTGSRRRRQRTASGGAAAAAAGGTRRRLRLVLLLCAASALLLVLLHLFGVAMGNRTKEAVEKAKDVLPLVLAAAGKGSTVKEGGDGDWVRLENGTAVRYRNPFGGTFSASLTTLSARATDDTPPLSEEWDFEGLRMRGVNLGGWLTLEPFITPSLFEPFLDSTTPGPAVDEWTLALNHLARGGREELERRMREHYEEFITELDFISIAAAGLNWVRLPVPHWAIRTWSEGGEEGGIEPMLEGVAWEYVLRAIRWARKYGLRINFDLHSVPGSQNGWNHSGRLGSINFLHGEMGMANAQRALDYIAAVAEFLSRPEVAPVVPMYSVLNEPMLETIGPDALRSFYTEAYETVRNATGYGRGKGPFLAFHDGFKGTHRWHNFLESPTSSPESSLSARRPPGPLEPRKVKKSTLSTNGMDRVALDSHRYLAFTEPDLRSVREQVMKPCLKWATEYNRTADNFGIAISGEFALAVNDCGRFLNNVFEGTRLEGTYPNASQPIYPPSAPVGTCEYWEDYTHWTDELKADLRDLAMAQMDTFQNWFYWTWKTTPSLLVLPYLAAANPLWSYSLGLSEGFLPADPRPFAGFCDSYPTSPRGLAAAGAAGVDPEELQVPKHPLGKLEAWKVGDPPSSDSSSPTAGEVGRLSAETKEREGVFWPPPEFDVPGGEYGAGGLATANLPRYARTAVGVYLPGPDEGGRGRPRLLRKGEEGRRWFAPIPGCAYPQDAWRASELPPEREGPWCEVEGAMEWE
ncbi:hypothetical protein JCM10213_008136 [Rhodosporidiobolus nylandii]